MQVVTGIPQRMLALTLLFGMIGITCYPQTPSREYQIKGAYVFNFAQFTQWPEDAFESNTDQFVIAIVGKDPFGGFMDELVKGETKTGHPIIVKRFRQIADVEAAHILFIARESTIDEAQLLRLTKDQNMLSISDRDGFARSGGMVELYIEDNKVKFVVNVEEGQRRGLQFSSKLLRLATICCK